MKRIFFSGICLVILSNIFWANGQTVGDPAQTIQVKENLTQAELLLKQGKNAEAIAILEKNSSLTPPDAATNFLLGKAFYAQNQYPQAIENLTPSVEKISKSAPEYREAVQMLGLSHYISGHLAAAIPYLEQLSGWSPDNQEIAYALGVSYVQTRQPAKSRETFARLFKVPTNSASAFLLNGQMLVKQQFEETAEIELNKALELDPKLPQTHFLLGELAIYRAEIDQGIEHLQKEIALNPAFAMAHYRLGEARARQLKWDEAIAPLQKSIWLNPFFSGPYIVLGKVYLKKSDLGNAENMLRRAAAIDPKNFSAHHLLAQTLQQRGNLEEAKKEFAVAEQLRSGGEKAEQL